MIFTSVKFQFSLAEYFFSQSKSCAETVLQKHTNSIQPHQEIVNEFCENTQVSNWEDEGGAVIDSDVYVYGDGRQ